MKATPFEPGAALPLLAAIAALSITVGCALPQYAHFDDPPSPTVRGSADRLTAEQIAEYPSSTSVEDLVTRHFPGLHLRGRREPGGTTSVQVLGMGTPLYVIDGVPQASTGGNLGINPRDIEYIQILKYGAATSLYGMRGANGVIIIATKH